MMIDRDYLLKKPAGPSAPKFFLDTTIVPLVANLAGGFEVALDRSARRMGVRPSRILAGAMSLAALGTLCLMRRRGATRHPIATAMKPAARDV